jgi:hypothetical protein
MHALFFNPSRQAGGSRLSKGLNTPGTLTAASFKKSRSYSQALSFNLTVGGPLNSYSSPSAGTQGLSLGRGQEPEPTSHLI